MNPASAIHRNAMAAVAKAGSYQVSVAGGSEDGDDVSLHPTGANTTPAAGGPDDNIFNNDKHSMDKAGAAAGTATAAGNNLIGNAATNGVTRDNTNLDGIDPVLVPRPATLEDCLDDVDGNKPTAPIVIEARIGRTRMRPMSALSRRLRGSVSRDSARSEGYVPDEPYPAEAVKYANAHGLLNKKGSPVGKSGIAAQPNTPVEASKSNIWAAFNPHSADHIDVFKSNARSAPVPIPRVSKFAPGVQHLADRSASALWSDDKFIAQSWIARQIANNVTRLAADNTKSQIPLGRRFPDLGPLKKVRDIKTDLPIATNNAQFALDRIAPEAIDPKPLNEKDRIICLLPNSKRPAGFLPPRPDCAHTGANSVCQTCHSMAVIQVSDHVARVEESKGRKLADKSYHEGREAWHRQIKELQEMNRALRIDHELCVRACGWWESKYRKKEQTHQREMREAMETNKTLTELHESLHEQAKIAHKKEVEESNKALIERHNTRLEEVRSAHQRELFQVKDLNQRHCHAMAVEYLDAEKSAKKRFCGKYCLECDSCLSFNQKAKAASNLQNEVNSLLQERNGLKTEVQRLSMTQAATLAAINHLRVEHSAISHTLASLRTSRDHWAAEVGYAAKEARVHHLYNDAVRMWGREDDQKEGNGRFLMPTAVLAETQADRIRIQEVLQPDVMLMGQTVRVAEYQISTGQLISRTEIPYSEASPVADNEDIRAMRFINPSQHQQQQQQHQPLPQPPQQQQQQHQPLPQPPQQEDIFRRCYNDYRATCAALAKQQRAILNSQSLTWDQFRQRCVRSDPAAVKHEYDAYKRNEAWHHAQLNDLTENNTFERYMANPAMAEMKREWDLVQATQQPQRTQQQTQEEGVELEAPNHFVDEEDDLYSDMEEVDTETSQPQEVEYDDGQECSDTFHRADCPNAGEQGWSVNCNASVKDTDEVVATEEAAEDDEEEEEEEEEEEQGPDHTEAQCFNPSCTDCHCLITEDEYVDSSDDDSSTDISSGMEDNDSDDDDDDGEMITTEEAAAAEEELDTLTFDTVSDDEKGAEDSDGEEEEFPMRSSAPRKLVEVPQARPWFRRFRGGRD